MKRALDHATELKVCKEYVEGMSTRRLSRKYGVGPATVINIMKRHGVARRPLSEAMRKYHVDHSHFDKVDTSGKAYFLGFLMAEAYMVPRGEGKGATLSVQIAMRDRNHLVNLRDELESDHPIYNIMKRKHPACRLQIKSDQLVADLHKHGVPFSGELTRFPTSLDPRLHSHFIRGFWDGDGTLVNNNGCWVWAVYGSLPLLTKIQDILVKNCGLKRTKIIKIKSIHAGTLYALQYSGNLQVPRIIEWIYRDATPQTCLDRNVRRVVEMYADLWDRGVGLCGAKTHICNKSSARPPRVSNTGTITEKSVGVKTKRGQSSAEMLILMGAILIAVTSLLYLGTGSNESAVVMRAARDGTENAIATLNAKHGCTIDIEELRFDAGTITISVIVRNSPAVENFDNIVKENIRTAALKYIQNAVYGSFPEKAEPVRTAYYTYDVAVEVRRVTK